MHLSLLLIVRLNHTAAEKVQQAHIPLCLHQHGSILSTSVALEHAIHIL